MAIGTPTVVASKDDTGDFSTYATASWTPTTTNLYVAFVGNRLSSAPTPTLTGNSLTWTQIATIPISGSDRRLTAFAAEGTGGTAGATTATFSGAQNACNIEIFEISGIDTSTVATSPGAGKTIIQAVTAAGSATTTPSVTYATGSDSANRNLTALKAHNAGTTVTPKSGWTELSEQATAETLEVQWKSSGFDPVSTATLSSSQVSALIGLELKAKLLGWGVEPWGAFSWGEEPHAPSSITGVPFLDYHAVAHQPQNFQRSRNVSAMSYLDYHAQAFTPTTFVLGARPATSLINTRRGVRRGLVRGKGTFRAAARVRGLDNASLVRGEYRVRGNAVRQKVSRQVTLGFINNAAVAYAPVSISSIVMPFLNYAATAYEPSVTQVRAVGRLSFLNYAATAYQISVSNVQLPFLDYTARAFTPFVPLQLPFINNAAVAYEPQAVTTVITARSITGMAFLNYAGTAYEPIQFVRGEAQQVNLPFIDNTARAITLFVHQEIPTAITLRASYDDSIELRATYDDVIRKKVIAMGTKAPIKKLDDWNEDEDQTFFWDLPPDQDATGWTTRFRLATEDGGAHLIEIDGLVSSSTQIRIDSPATGTAGLGGRKYFYELARIDLGHHQRIAHGDAWLGSRIS